MKLERDQRLQEEGFEPVVLLEDGSLAGKKRERT